MVKSVLYKKIALLVVVLFSGITVFSQTGNHVFSVAEQVNFGVESLSTSTSWSTFRGEIPGYFSAVGIGTYIDADDTHNVDGYVKHYTRAVNQGFTFPVGTGSDLRTLTTSGTIATNSEFATAWIAGDPSDTIDPTAPNSGMHAITSIDSDLLIASALGQWDWQDISGTSAGITVTVSIPNLTGFSNAKDLRLIGWNGTKWVNLSGTSGASGVAENSTLSGTLISGITAIGIGVSKINHIMITQVYHSGTAERWIEITNKHLTRTIPANTIKAILYTNKSGNQTGIVPDNVFIIPKAILPGNSILIKKSTSTITNISGTAIVNDNVTNFDAVNDIITISITTDKTAWDSRIDVVKSIKDNTSYVRIDETLLPNTTYTASEWVVFVDDRAVASGGLDPYANPPERHSHDPLLSEIASSNTEANTLLGLHRFGVTKRIAAPVGTEWDNGYPDRSRNVVIEADYNHTGARLSARKLSVNSDSNLAITNNLLVVTNDITLARANDEIRLVGSSQLVQTHTGATQVTGQESYW